MTLVEVLVVIGIFTSLFGLLLPAVQCARRSASRTERNNNIHQIALGLHGYHAFNSHFPSGITLRTNDYMYMGWHTRLLPYIEQGSVWREAIVGYSQYPYDFKLTPHPFSNVIKTYVCPSDGRASQPRLARGKFTAGLTSYVGVSGTRTLRRDGVLFANSAVRIADILDGLSNTIAIGERPPSKDCGPKSGGLRVGDLDSMCSAFHFWSMHPGGANFAFADGSVWFIAYSHSFVLPTLATRAGGETPVSID